MLSNKHLPLFFSALLLIAASCKSNKPVLDPVVDPWQEDSTHVDINPDAPEEGYVDVESIKSMWKTEYADTTNGFSTRESVVKARYSKDGQYLSASEGSSDRSRDSYYCYEFYNESAFRFVSLSDGFALTIPSESEVSVDYTLGRNGLWFQTDLGRLRITEETVTPYSHDRNGYGIYVGEWLNRYIDNPKYLRSNNLEYSSPTVYDNTEILPGYAVSIWSIHIKSPGKIAYPYYKIAIARKADQWSKFYLIVYKTARADRSVFETVVASLSKVTRFGTRKSLFPEQKPMPNPNWNAATAAYYDRMVNEDTFDFGVFVASMPDDGEDNYNSIREKISTEKARLEGENGIGHKFEIMPTYRHIGWYSIYNYFPSSIASEFAGGDGFNGKPVLEFTFQYTMNNNNVSVWNTDDVATPMFNLLRGSLDVYFLRLAQMIKDYDGPILFRLNNEMNTDWTSYCGMMTLVDPELFADSWRYVYDLFEENGVDNCIFIFNPIAVTCPFSEWGEWQAYYPGNEYCQVLGITNYEANNVSSEYQSFRKRYTDLWNQYGPYFSQMPWFIGEYGCGAGGNTSGALYRNQSKQAEWVRGMFDDLADRKNHEYLKCLKGGMWFGVNDYGENGSIVNQYSLDQELTETLAAFREGFKKLESAQ